MEIYGDDIIIKSRKRETTLEDLKKVFTQIREIEIKVNPKKCTFGVLPGTCSGYMASEREIEANHAKVKAIRDMVELKSIKEVKLLASCMASLGQFLSTIGEKGLPFYHILKCQSNFEWTKKGSVTFL